MQDECFRFQKSRKVKDCEVLLLGGEGNVKFDGGEEGMGIEETGDLHMELDDGDHPLLSLLLLPIFLSFFLFCFLFLIS